MRPKRKTVEEEKIRKPGVCSQGFIVDDRIYPLYSGSFHYWRHPRELWEPLLDSVAGMGFKTICTYIPWSVHEAERGRFDYEGDRDIEGFIRLCGDKGFRLLLRPGPHINSELSYFGYPERILYDEEIMARTSLDTPCMLAFGGKHFPIPSYASEKFYEEAAVYFDSLIPMLAKHVYPGGPVIGIQSDNETSYFFKGLAPYELDYHPDSIRLYQAMLKEIYGDIAALNQHYRVECRDFTDVPPPRDFLAKKKHDMGYYLDWGKYKEYQIKYAIERIAEMFRKRGIKQLPVYHNYPFAWNFPFDVAGTENLPEIAIAGFDHYGKKEKYPLLKAKSKFLAGSSRLPFIPEFGAGLWLSIWDSYSPEDEEFITLNTFMHGVKAVNYYMIVERERWTGSPVTRDNRIREGYFEKHKRINSFLYASKFHQFKKIAPVLVLQNYDVDRLLYVSRRWLPASMGAEEDLQIIRGDFNFADECFACRKWHERVTERLEERRVDYDLASTQVAVERMCDYRYAFLPTAPFMSAEVMEKLKSYAAKGGRLVIGPYEARFDYYLGRGKQLKEGVGITLLEEEGIGEFIDALELDPGYSVNERAVEFTLFEKDGRRIIFIANPTPEKREIRVSFPGEKKFRDLIDGKESAGISSITMEMAPWKIKVLEVTGD